MRLLKLLPDGKWGVTPDLHKNELLLYAILSHTWDHDGQEVTFDELLAGQGTTKRGWQKLEFCVRQTNMDGLRHCWADNCCIDKANPAEKHDAFNTMFSWYEMAHVCYVYLADVTGLSDLGKSRWWTRGWTLQELLAPRNVVFYSRDGACLGTKLSLLSQIHEITGISKRALSGEEPLWSFNIEERLSWMKGRRTTFEEDYAYCLQGVLGVEIARRYGEGLKRAIARLKEEAALMPKTLPTSTRLSLPLHGRPMKRRKSDIASGSQAGFGSSPPPHANIPVFGAPGTSKPPPPPDALYGQTRPEVLLDSDWAHLDLDLSPRYGVYPGNTEMEEVEKKAQQKPDAWDGANVVVTLEDLGISPQVERPLGVDVLPTEKKDLWSRRKYQKAITHNTSIEQSASGVVNDKRLPKFRPSAFNLTIEDEDDLAGL